jgi:hypothetical protein
MIQIFLTFQKELNEESPVGRENLIWRENAKIGCLWTQLDFIEGLIEFIEVLIARKFDF